MYRWGARVVELTGGAHASRLKVCTKCLESKPLTGFDRDARASDERRSMCKACMSAWYRGRVDTKAEDRRLYRENNREKVRQINLNYRQTKNGQAGALYRSAKQRAGKKRIEFSLSPEWVIERVLAGVCEATGLPLSFGTSGDHRPNTFAPSIDRKDPRGGYTPENSRVVIWAFNALKGHGTDEDVLTVAKAIVAKEGLQ